MVGADRTDGDTGTQRPGPSRHRGAQDSARLVRRRRCVRHRRRSRRPHPERHSGRHRQSDDLGAGGHRRRVRSAELSLPVVAAALAVRGGAGLRPVGRVLDVWHGRRPARTVLAGCPPPCPARPARRRAVRSVRGGVLDLARADQYLVGDAADDPARARRHRMGDVRPRPASAPLHTARACPTCRGRSASARRPCAPG